ncbi:heme/hemin ABC transporter substrate-binding protein [Thorsellia kenyensis]|uniref:Hemin ABC transporter substrate-binding protein n=1 Tax=Thorsellia kenyensis TaxID=1549888 RepID=A0ABV6CA22_9GAMM
MSLIKKIGKTDRKLNSFILKTKYCILAWTFFASLNVFAQNDKIVSVGGDITEIIYALGHGDKIVARDSTSLEPKQVLSLPDIGYMRLLNTEGILANNPSVVFTSIDAGPSSVFEQIEALGIPVHKIASEKSLEGTLSKITTIGELLSEEVETKKLLATYQSELDSIDSTPLDINVLFLLTFDGHAPSAAGQLTAPDSLFKAIGVKNAAGDIKKYQPITSESLAMMQPDVIVVSKEGLRQLTEEKIWQLPGIDKTPAYKNKQLLVVDDGSFLGFTLETPATVNALKKSLATLIK